MREHPRDSGDAPPWGDGEKQEEVAMPKYLIEARYTADAAKALKSEGGSARAAATKTLIEGLSRRARSTRRRSGT
jgi:hypothetical protein